MSFLIWYYSIRIYESRVNNAACSNRALINAIFGFTPYTKYSRDEPLETKLFFLCDYVLDRKTYGVSIIY